MAMRLPPLWAGFLDGHGRLALPLLLRVALLTRWAGKPAGPGPEPKVLALRTRVSYSAILTYLEMPLGRTHSAGNRAFEDACMFCQI